MKNATIILIITILFLLPITKGSGQEVDKIDSLTEALSKATQDTSKINTLLRLGEANTSTDTTNAIGYLEEALEFSKEIEDLHFEYKSILTIGQYYFNTKRYQQSIDTLAQLVSRINDTGERELLMKAYNGIGRAEFNLADYTEAIRYFELSYEVSEEIQHGDYMVKTLANAGAALNLLGEYSKALEYYDKALEVNKLAKSELGLLLSYSNMGVTYYNLANYTKANDYFFEALGMAIKLDDARRIATINANLAAINNQLKNYDLGEEYNLKSLKISKENGFPIYFTLNNTGDTYSLMDNDSLALVYYNQGLEEARSINNKRYEALSLLSLGRFYKKNNQIRKAKNYLDSALILKNELGDSQSGFYGIYNILAEFHRDYGNKEMALDYAIQGRNISEKSGEVRSLMVGHSLLSEIYELKYDYKNALANHKIYVELKDSIYSNDNVKKMTSMEMQFKFDKQKELTALERQKEDKLYQAEIRQQKQLRNALIIGGAIFLVLAVVILINLMQKRKANKVLAEQKEEILAQTEELKTTNDKLVELGQFKEGMTGMIVHDLKNPLNSIINLSKDTYVQQSGKQMLNMVMNILDVYKYEQTQMTVDKVDHSLYEISQNAINEVAFLAEQKSIALTNTIDKQMGAKCDSEITVRILVNLLTNAIKYTPNNGNISLSSSTTQNGFVTVEVKDSGQGIPKENLSSVFDKFGQVSAKKSGSVRSTGLGLTFCKMAVEAHGGEIGVESEVDKGATFHFTLPHGVDKQHNAADNGKLSNKEEIKLSALDIEILKPYIDNLGELLVYQTTDIENILIEIESNESRTIQNWISGIRECLFTMNQEKYESLISA